MPTPRSTEAAAFGLAKRQRIVRLRDFEEQGIPRAKVLRWAAQGRLVRAARGLYTLPGQDFGENDSLVQVAKLVPNGIICRLSALRVHELTTQNHRCGR
jgi:predicted transcriptional regulator of viral defense system